MSLNIFNPQQNKFNTPKKAFGALAVLATTVFIIGIFAWISPSQARESAPAFKGDFTVIKVGDLPKEARETLALIRKGGPFPYSKDGVVFGNREKLFPKQPRGFYHEYTVKTPGARNRGARRIVCGGNPQPSAECFYSDDHYETFRKIKE